MTRPASVVPFFKGRMGRGIERIAARLRRSIFGVCSIARVGSPDEAKKARVNGMTVQELIARFPEIPQDLREEPLLARFAEACEALLRHARKPSPCSTQHDAANHFYLKLIGPLAIYGYGLSSREKVLRHLRELIERQEADPEGFGGSLLPQDAAHEEVKGPGCS